MPIKALNLGKCFDLKKGLFSAYNQCQAALWQLKKMPVPSRTRVNLILWFIDVSFVPFWTKWMTFFVSECGFVNDDSCNEEGLVRFLPRTQVSLTMNTQVSLSRRQTFSSKRLAVPPQRISSPPADWNLGNGILLGSLTHLDANIQAHNITSCMHTKTDPHRSFLFVCSSFLFCAELGHF